MKRQLGQIACTGLALLVSTSLMANPEPWQLNMTPGVTSTSQDVYQLHMLILWICVAIGVVFDSLNSYGGTIGEVLGVSIFAAVAIALLSISAIRTRALPVWLGVFGLIAALAVLSTTVELFGADASSLIFFGTTLVQLWFLAVGVWLLVRGRTRATN